MFTLIRSAACGTFLSDDEKSFCRENMTSEAADVAKRHDVANMLAFGLKKNGLPVSNEPEISKAVYRYTKQDYELNNICNALETAKIAFIPLKGSVIRKYYPEPWLRTGADIDVLIHKSDIEAAKTCFTEKLKYKFDGMNEYDVSFYSLSGCHTELHFNLIDDDLVETAKPVLEDVWNDAVKYPGCEYRHEMSAEMFYFYHITHMAKHFLIGGCGIRPFVDLYILNHNFDFDREKCGLLLESGQLTDFAKTAALLSEAWFGNGEQSETTLRMQEYILRGGVFGTHENHVAVQQQKMGGKVQYVLYKIFIPYKELKNLYPVLEKHRWLLPIMEVRRWCRHIFFWRFKRAANELKSGNSVSKEAADNLRALFDDIGL